MAGTKKKRRTKHRGNAAGIVESRGRTGRKPDGSPGGSDPKSRARRARIDRYAQPPTWRSAANRALVATVIFALVVIFAFGQTVSSTIALAGFMLILYIPLGYYTDVFFYRRRQAKLGRPRGDS